ncbi:MAG: hypothetical protein ABR571_18955 [Jatrophihabitans sp.]|uniref:hypothetical protein n=1 Tax=Jatrophihabitans sp. TaxID=1932789 RepID=UPI0039158F66
MTVTGSPLSDVASWCAAVLAPGGLVVGLSRRAVDPSVEDVTRPAPPGCLVAMLGWFSDPRALVSAGAFGLGPLLVLVALAYPRRGG